MASLNCWSQRSAVSPTSGIVGRKRFEPLVPVVVGRRHPRPVKRVGDAADPGANRHLVVVKNHQELGPRAAGVVERLKDDSRGERAVANDGDRMALRVGP